MSPSLHEESPLIERPSPSVQSQASISTEVATTTTSIEMPEARSDPSSSNSMFTEAINFAKRKWDDMRAKSFKEVPTEDPFETDEVIDLMDKFEPFVSFELAKTQPEAEAIRKVAFCQKELDKALVDLETLTRRTTFYQAELDATTDLDKRNELYESK